MPPTQRPEYTGNDGITRVDPFGLRPNHTPADPFFPDTLTPSPELLAGTGQEQETALHGRWQGLRSAWSSLRERISGHLRVTVGDTELSTADSLKARLYEATMLPTVSRIRSLNTERQPWENDYFAHNAVALRGLARTQERQRRQLEGPAALTFRDYLEGSLYEGAIGVWCMIGNSALLAATRAMNRRPNSRQHPIVRALHTHAQTRQAVYEAGDHNPAMRRSKGITRAEAKQRAATKTQG